MNTLNLLGVFCCLCIAFAIAIPGPPSQDNAARPDGKPPNDAAVPPQPQTQPQTKPEAPATTPVVNPFKCPKKHPECENLKDCKCYCNNTHTWALEDCKCRTFLNDCEMKQENCARLKKGSTPLVEITQEECKCHFLPICDNSCAPVYVWFARRCEATKMQYFEIRTEISRCKAIHRGIIENDPPIKIEAATLTKPGTHPRP